MIKFEKEISISSNWTDEHILRVLQSEDYETNENLAWMQLVEKYEPELDRRALTLMKGNDFWASDLVQDTWIKAYKSITQCKGNLKGWLMTIMLNQFRDDLRKNRLESIHLMVRLEQVNPEIKAPDLTESAAGFIKERKAFEADFSYLSGMTGSAEQIFADNEVVQDFNTAVKEFLSASDAEFFLAYQNNNQPKTGKDKVKFHRLKKKIKDACFI